METTQNEIKAWLRSIGKDRNWLGEQLNTTKSVVDSWFSTRGFPDDRMQSIMALMSPDDFTSMIRIPFTDDQLAKTQQAMKIVNNDNIQIYCQRAIEREVSKDLGETHDFPISKAAEDEGPAPAMPLMKPNRKYPKPSYHAE